MSYNAIVTRIQEVKKHPNADRLALATVLGKQIITSLDAQVGDVGIYFPSDGQLSHDYCMANGLYRKNPENGLPMGGYFEENRRVRIIKMRGEISDGFFAPLSSLNYLDFDAESLKVGSMFNFINGEQICNKYVTEETVKMRTANNKAKTVKPSSLPTFYRVGDTANLNFFIDTIPLNSFVVVSDKMHGTSGRTGLIKYQPIAKKGIMARLINYFINSFGLKEKQDYRYISGTRKTILENGAYHLKDDYRIEAHNRFVGKLHEGEIVYYEIVGYAGNNTTIQPSHDTTKFPELEEIFGKEVLYTYGCKPGEHEIYVYRMGINNESGVWTEYPWWKVVERCQEMDINTVVVLNQFIHTDPKQTIFRIKKMVNDYVYDPVGTTHPLEGVCLRINDTVYKFKSDTFCLLEDIKLDSGKYVDPEEIN